MASKYEMDMTEGPLLSKIIRYSIPLIFTTLLQLFYNAADTIVVGRFSGDAALAAVGSTGSLTTMIVQMFFGLSVGTAVVVSQYLGAKDYAKVEKSVHTSVALSFASSVLLTVVGIVAARSMLTLMATPADVIDGATLYMRIYFAGMPGNLLYNFGSAILRAAGDTKRPLYILTSTGLINVILNLILVICFDMGVAGVAIATIVSQYISAVLVMAILIRSENAIHFSWKKLGFDGDALRRIVKIGLPAGIQGTIFSISNVIIQSTINSFGTTTIAAVSAANNLEGFASTTSNAIYQSCLSFVGQNVGANKLDRVKKTVKMCIFFSATTMTLAGVAIWYFSPSLLTIYTDNPEVIRIGTQKLLFTSTTHAFAGLMDVMSGALRGIGKSTVSMINSICGVCGIRLVYIYTIFRLNPTFNMLNAAYPISWTATFLVHLVVFFFAFRKLEKGEANALT